MDNSLIMLKNYRQMELALDNIKTDIDTTFAPVKVFSDADVDLFNQINLSRGGTFNFFGSIYSDQIKNLMIEFFESLGIDRKLAKSLCKILLSKAVIPYLVANHVDCLWIKIVGMFPTTHYVVPRWHFDGSFYDMVGEYQLKLVGALIGPSTLFKKTNHIEVDNFVKEHRKLHAGFTLEDYDKGLDIKNRPLLDDYLKNIETMQLTNADINIFTVGKIPKVAIHSEPNINTKRLFFSVVAGSSNNIKQLAERWNEVFMDK